VWRSVTRHLSSLSLSLHRTNVYPRDVITSACYLTPSLLLSLCVEKRTVAWRQKGCKLLPPPSLSLSLSARLHTHLCALYSLFCRTLTSVTYVDFLVGKKKKKEARAIALSSTSSALPINPLPFLLHFLSSQQTQQPKRSRIPGFGESRMPSVAPQRPAFLGPRDVVLHRSSKGWVPRPTLGFVQEKTRGLTMELDCFGRDCVPVPPLTCWAFPSPTLLTFLSLAQLWLCD
jgi:hypothetical protein